MGNFPVLIFESKGVKNGEGSELECPNSEGDQMRHEATYYWSAR